MAEKLQITTRHPAKTNLSLKVVGKLENGMHQIRSLFAPISLADEIAISVEPASTSQLEVSTKLTKDLKEHLADSRGFEIELNSPKNLAYRAAEQFLEKQGGTYAVKVEINKCIPPEAGLGGGSSNAACVLTNLNSLIDEPLEPSQILEIATELGSDIAALVEPGLIFVHGTGNKLLPIKGEIKGLADASILLLKSPAGVSTKEAYHGLFHEPGSAISDELNCQAGEKELKKFGLGLESTETPEPAAIDWLQGIFNDFEASVFGSSSEIRDLYELANKIVAERLGEGAGKVFLSGSGSALAIVVRDDSNSRKVELLKDAIRSELPSNYWFRTCKFVD